MPKKSEAIALLELFIAKDGWSAEELIDALTDNNYMQPMCRKDGKYEWQPEDDDTNTRQSE